MSRSPESGDNLPFTLTDFDKQALVTDLDIQFPDFPTAADRAQWKIEHGRNLANTPAEKMLWEGREITSSINTPYIRGAAMIELVEGYWWVKPAEALTILSGGDPLYGSWMPVGHAAEGWAKLGTITPNLSLIEHARNAAKQAAEIKDSKGSVIERNRMPLMVVAHIARDPETMREALRSGTGFMDTKPVDRKSDSYIRDLIILGGLGYRYAIDMAKKNLVERWVDDYGHPIKADDFGIQCMALIWGIESKMDGDTIEVISHPKDKFKSKKRAEIEKRWRVFLGENRDAVQRWLLTSDNFTQPYHFESAFMSVQDEWNRRPENEEDRKEQAKQIEHQRGLEAELETLQKVRMLKESALAIVN